MARQSYLSRIAGTAPAPALQLTAVTDAADAPPAALSSLLQHLSSPAGPSEPPVAAANFPATVAATAADASGEPTVKAPRLTRPPQIHPVRLDQPAPTSPAPEPGRFPLPHRPEADPPLVIKSVSETMTAATPPEPRRTAPPEPQAARPGTAVAVQSQPAQPVPVQVHIGTVEVRAKAPAVHAAPPAPAPTTAPARSAPPRGYGWGFGLTQR